MSKVAVDFEKELQSQGIYPQTGTWYGAPYNPIERLTPPISPAENLLRYYRGEDYEWIPDICSDCVDITPDCIPDVVASGYDGGLDNFGVKWIPVGDGSKLPSFVEPNFVLLEDIADWKDLVWPDVDNWDWERYGRTYCENHKNDDRLRRGVLLSGYFERLISIMTFEEAAVALITDPESVTEYFDKLTEMNLKIMDHYIKDFGCQSILIHDDWSAQRSPFFSLQVAQELLAPQVKKLADHAHAQGVIFTLHSCGNGADLVPAMKAAGVDAWQAQGSVVEPHFYEACGDDLLIECRVFFPEGLAGEELEKTLEDILRSRCTNHRNLPYFFEFDPERLPKLRRAVYKVSRKLAAEGSCK